MVLGEVDEEGLEGDGGEVGREESGLGEDKVELRSGGGVGGSGLRGPGLGSLGAIGRLVG